MYRKFKSMDILGETLNPEAIERKKYCFMTTLTEAKIFNLAQTDHQNVLICFLKLFRLSG